MLAADPYTINRIEYQFPTGQDHLSGKVKLGQSLNLVSVDYTPSLNPVSRLSPGGHERKYTTT